MDSSQLYILKNKSFQRNILKIGMTKKQTNSRAKQLYSGATGVPEPFDVLFACSVADCRAAESIVHRRLAAFRVNNSREFFRIPAKIARQIVFEVCSNLNTERQHDRPIISVDLITTQEPEPPINDQYQEKYGEIFSIPHEEIVQLPIGTTILSKTQKERISIVSHILHEVFPECEEGWHESFSRDKKPEPEIRIWEHIAKAFLKIDEIDYLNTSEKEEAYDLLFARSLSPTKIVLQQHTLRYFTKEAAMKIMAGYELSPKPITVSRVPPETWITNTPTLKPITSAISKILASQRKRT
ncbi:GIY-YIG nuclease family protein [Janthinobacterium rivuli]|uniref:GIY-YIG nuclease family protein n=2 Tax=Janthinobacterium rivuli TaxID=2751478 RepID=A0ABY8IBL6_9BURK|nr:GIY-YIG nuclease family protein [Janthinobacterium rivuli]WFR81342.1 GIY-YIG nuclease family protein [Janthinobacterium rivuli]